MGNHNVILFIFFFNFVYLVLPSSTTQPLPIFRIPKIPKCCGLGEVLLDRKCQYVPPNRFNFTIEFYSGQLPLKKVFPYEVVPYQRCENAVVLDSYYIQLDGTLLIPDSTEFLSEDEYCIDVDFQEKEPHLLVLWCYNIADVLEPPLQVFSGGN